MINAKWVIIASQLLCGYLHAAAVSLVEPEPPQKVAANEIKVGYTSAACKKRYEKFKDRLSHRVRPCIQKYDVADKIEVTVDKAGMDYSPGYWPYRDIEKKIPLRQKVVVKIWRKGKVETRTYPASAGDANYWADDEILRLKLGKVGRGRPTKEQIKRLEDWKSDKKNWLYWLSRRRTYETPEGKNFRIERNPKYTQGHCVGKNYNYANAPMPYSLFFKGGAAIHATTRRALGLPGSHGCVGLANHHARELFCLMRQKPKSGGKENWKRTRVTVVNDSVPPPIPEKRPPLKPGWLAKVILNNGQN